jgi:hypothetical protein
MFLRKTYGSRLNTFQPIGDLSALSKSGSEGRALIAGQRNDVAIAGGQILGDEYSEHVVKASSITPSAFPFVLILPYNRTEVVSFFERGKCDDAFRKNALWLILLRRMLLKSDQWLKESRHVTDGVRGAISFRRIPETQIYALGQPTLDAIDEVVARVKQDNPSAERILWVTLREEPIVYINGTPYCLRRERFTLRNMKGVCLSTKIIIIINDKAI